MFQHKKCGSSSPRKVKIFKITIPIDHLKKSCLSQGTPGSPMLNVKFINFDFPESGQAI